MDIRLMPWNDRQVSFDMCTVIWWDCGKCMNEPRCELASLSLLGGCTKNYFLLTRMSSSERRRNVESGEEAAAAHEHLSQERLQILLHRLGWSYAALWTLNPQTRSLFCTVPSHYRIFQVQCVSRTEQFECQKS